MRASDTGPAIRPAPAPSWASPLKPLCARESPPLSNGIGRPNGSVTDARGSFPLAPRPTEPRPKGAEILSMISARDWWPVDKIILAYFASSTLLELIYWTRLPNPLELTIAHLIGAVIIAAVTSN